MHSAYMRLNEADKALIFRASGHTGYADAGRDIVCSSASIITMGLADLLKDAQRAGWLTDVIVDLSAEKTEISCVTTDADTYGEIARCYLFASKQYGLLAKHYPQYVRFRREIKEITP